MLKTAMILALAVAPIGQTPSLQPAAQSDAPLAPAGKWDVDFGDNFCSLERQYGPGGALLLGMRPLTGGKEVKLVVVSDQPLIRDGVGKAKVSLDDTAFDFQYQSYPFGRNQRLLVIFGDRGLLDALPPAKLLRIQLDATHRIAFTLSATQQLVQVVQQCEKELAVSWGVDVERVASAPEPIRLQDWFNDAYNPGYNAGLSVRLQVGPNGRVANCTVIAASGAPLLDESACQILRVRARFKPALDKDGKPMTGLWSSSITYESE